MRLNKNRYANEEEPRGGFMCRGCWEPQAPPLRPQRPRWGDAVDYLMHVRKMTYTQAQAFLRQQEGTIPSQESIQHRGHTEERPDYRSPQWQELVKSSMLHYVTQLWSPEDTRARDYVRSRGLSDKTSHFAEFGYSLAGGIPRLLIPVYNAGQYKAIYRRDLRPEIPSQERWRDVAGGTKSELYLADMLNRIHPTVITEAAIDALSVWQDCRDIVNVVATGSASCGKLIKWLHILSCMPLILLAFDADASGDQEALWWLAKLPNARRLRPTAHDLNAMLVTSGSLRPWLLEALAQPAQPERTTTIPDAPLPLPQPIASTEIPEMPVQDNTAKIDTDAFLTPAGIEPTIETDEEVPSNVVYLRFREDNPRHEPEAASQTTPTNTPAKSGEIARPIPPFLALEPAAPVQSVMHTSSVETTTPLEPLQTALAVPSAPDTALEGQKPLLTWPTAEMIAQNVAEFETKGIELQQLEEIISTSRRVAAICIRGPYTLTIYPHDYPIEQMMRDSERDQKQREQDEALRNRIVRRKDES